MRLTDRTVDLARLTIEHDGGESGSLTAREGALLAYLAERPEQDVSRDELLERVWEYKANYATRAVDVAMRRLRAKIEPDPSNPVHLISVHGVGYRFVPASAPAPAPAPAAPPPDRRTNLPADQTSFVGRSEDLAAVARQFRSGARLVTVTGPGGIGKTRLAQRFGRNVFESAAPPGGVWFCDLTDVVALPGLVAAVASSLGVPLSGGSGASQLAEQLGHALVERGPILVILDNFEQLVGFAAETVGAWMQLAPKARFLVASRERLRVSGEAIYELGPLAEEDARSLFLERARAAGGEVDDEDASIPRIIQRLDGMPLAIELAASRARVLSPAQLHDRLSARFRLLRSSGPGTPRQATLRGAIDWSWELLAPWERSTLLQCAAFVGGFTLEAVEAVVDNPEPDAPWALDIVEALRDKSLLRVYEPPDLPGELRFGMYESIRAYAVERLDDADADAVAARHAAWYLAEGERLAEACEGHDGLDASRRLALETENLLAVWRRRAKLDPEVAVRAALVLETLFQTRGPLDVWYELTDDVVELARERAPALYPRALTARANAHGLRGQLERAHADLALAAPLVEGRGDETEVRVLHARAITDAERSRLAVARERCERALELARAAQLRRWEGILTGLLGAFEIMGDEVARGEDHMRRALAIHQEVGNERHQALTWTNLGMIQLDHGRLDEAERHLQHALIIDRRMQNPRRVATSLLTLSAVRGEQWRLSEAESLARDALRIYRSVGYRRFTGIGESALATLLLAQGRLDAALETARSSLQVLEEIGDPHSTCLVTALLAAIQAERDELTAADASLERARALAVDLSFGQGDGYLRVAEGFRAVAAAREARRRSLDDGAHLERARTLAAGEPGDSGHHAWRFFARSLEKAIARSERGVPRGPW